MPDENSFANATILVVDDTPPNVKLMRVILGDAGYRVIEAYSGAEGLEILHRDRPDVMLLDVRMPGMTGYEVCSRIREDPEFATLPVIMVTSLSLAEERIRGIEAGATDFISKPFNKKELLARVRASLVMAKYGKHGIVPQLPGAVLITDPAWKVIVLSPLAAVLLNISPSGAIQFDFAQLLENNEKYLLASEDVLFDFQLHPGRTLQARHIAVRNPDGELIMRLISLSERGAPETAAP
ncbi:MAG: response regulator [Gallionella sp.]